MAYLGRISAVLTANTRDFTRQIGTARRELQDFARQARGTQLNLDNRALNGTLTNLQRFQRTLQEIQRLQNAGIDAGLPDARRLRDQFRLFEDLGRPLTDVKNRIEGLSNAIQSELYPELGRVQQGFRNLYRQIGEGATSFDQSAARIDNLRQRLIGLSRATAALSDLNSLTRQLNSNNAGASFFTPRAQEALQQSIRLRGQAQALPSRFRENGAFADLAVQAEENAERVERAAARVARAQLRVINEGENPATLANRSRAQSELDVLTRQQRGINLGFEREIASAQIQQIVSPEAPRQADRLIERLKSLASELRAIDGKQFNGLIASTAAVVDQFNRGEISANRARAAVDRLAQSLEAAGRVQAGRQIGRDLQEQADQLLFSERERRQRKIQSAFDTATANVPAGDPRRRRAELDRDITLRRDQLVSEIIPRTTGLADQARQTGDQQAIRSAAELLQVNRQINNELTKSANLASQNKYDESEASLRRVNSLLQRQSDLEEDIAGRVDISNAARRQTQLFLEQSGGLGEQLSQGARDAASDISVGRQFRGGIRDGGARIAIANEIDRIEQSVADLQRQMATVAASDLGADEKIAELNRLDNEVRESTSGLAEFIAAQAAAAAAAEGGVAPYSAAQVQAAMDRGKNNAGSIGIGGGAAAQLAFQQGLFAIDDFVSSTGGLEYKIRAIGNNITQLGLLLGQSGVIPWLTATRGLFLSLGAVLVGQAAIAIYKWADGATTAEDRVKSLNDSLARQKSLVEQLAQAFESLGDSIARKGFSSGGQAAREFSKELDSLAKKQRESRELRVSDLDSSVQDEKGRQAALRRRLEGTTDGGQRVAILREIEDSQRRERAAARVAVSRPPASPDELRQAVAESIRGNEFLVGGRLTSESMRRAEARRAAAAAEFDAAGSDPVALARILEQRISERQQTAARDITAENLFSGEATEIIRAREDVANLGRLLESLRLPANAKIDESIRTLFRAAETASVGLQTAQQQAEDAFRAGIPSAVGLQSTLDSLAGEIDGSLKAISQAQKDFAEGRISNEDRSEIVAREERRLRSGRAARDRALDRAADLTRERIVDPQRLFDARRSRAEANLSESGLGAGATARRIRELEARRSEVESRLQREGGLANPFAARRASRDLDAINREMAAIEATTVALRRFTEAISRAEQEARSNLDSARQREEDVRRQSLAPAGLATQADRRQAERDLEEQRQANQRVEDAASRARLRIEREANDPNNPLAATFARLREIEELAQGGQLTDGLIEERRRLQRQVDAAVQQDASVVAARDDSTRIAERQASEQRGRDLLLRPGERAARELQQSVADIRAATKQNVDRAIREGRPQDVAGERQRGREAERRALFEQLRNTAPTIFGLADSVANAVLQGPSRAALQATDVSTVEGSRELTRLLRGDDAARDQANLVELQKEANRLLDIIANAPAPVAN